MTSSPRSRTATAASRSTSRWARIPAAGPGRGPVGHLARPAAARLPRTARRRGRHRRRQRHGRRPAAALARHGASGAGPHRPPRPDELRELRPVPAGRAQAGVGAVPRAPPARPRAGPAAGSVVGRPAQDRRQRRRARAGRRAHGVVLRARATRPRVAEDLVAAMGGFRPQLLLDAAAAIPQLRPAGAARLGRLVRVLPGRACGATGGRLPRRDAAPCPEPRRGSRSTIRPRWPTRSSRSCRG